MINDDEIIDTNERICLLNRKVDYLTDLVHQLIKKNINITPSTILNNPDYSLKEWIDDCVVNIDIVKTVCTLGAYEGFQYFIKLNHNKGRPMPLICNKRKIYVFIGYWEVLNETQFYEMVTHIWQIILKHYMDMAPIINQEIDNDTQDIYRKQVSTMRQQLCNVQKRRSQIKRWLTEIVSM